MTKQILHVPRGSSKSYVDKIKEQYDLSNKVRRINPYNIISDDVYMRYYQTDNCLIFCNQKHTSNRLKRININRCNFENIKNDFEVNYYCSYCRKKQQILNTDILFSQFIYKPINTFSDIRIYCNSCQKTNVVPLRLFIKKILSSYTTESIESYNNDLNALLTKLKQILQFDCMLNGKTTYTVESDNLKDLIYD